MNAASLDMRILIAYCMPHPAQSPEAISKIAEIYQNGDLTNKVKKHRSFIFYNKQGRTTGKYKVSKAIDNLISKNHGCPYIT